MNSIKKEKKSWVLVFHACNPSYSGGRDQEDHGRKEASPGNSLRELITKKVHHRKGLVE
jgi:hypothetical protein